MPPKFFDIHCHLNFPDFYKKEEVGNLLKSAHDAGVWLINVGSDYESSKLAVEIAEKYDEGVYATVGLHPDDNKNEIFDLEKYRELARHPKVVAIGECGLDYYDRKSEARNTKSEINSKIKIQTEKNENQNINFEDEQQRQKDIFKKQIELAIEVNKPLMVHCRDSHDDVLEILSSYSQNHNSLFTIHNSRPNGNIHFFSGTPEQAQKYFDLGFMISFTGVITFTHDYDEVIKFAPLDKIMIETDAPFVTPIPYRGQKNQPLFVQEVAKKIAEIKGISLEEVCEATTKNAMRFAGLI